MGGRILIGVIVIAVIVAALVLGQGGGRPSLTRTTPDAPAEAPGYSARDARIIETGDDGRPVYTLNARRIHQTSNDRRVQLDAPTMTYVATDGSTWNLSARAGQIQPDGTNVHLFGNVDVRGKLSERQQIQIGTSILSFDTRQEVVHTTAPVTFDSGSGRQAAQGLVVNLKDGSVKLESRVHGTFPPRR